MFESRKSQQSLELLHRSIRQARAEFDRVNAFALKAIESKKMSVAARKKTINVFDVDKMDLMQELYDLLSQVYPTLPPFRKRVQTSRKDKSEAIVEKWLGPPDHRSLAPRTKEQIENDKNHATTTFNMSNFTDKMKKRSMLRFVNEEDEERDRLLAFGNPFKVRYFFCLPVFILYLFVYIYFA